MPKTKLQKIIFGLLMSYIMAYGMELYNISIKMGFHSIPSGFTGITYEVFLDSLIEATYMGAIVFIVSNLFGNKFGAKFMSRHCDPEKDNPYFCQLMRQAGTVAVMCPAMSFVASILFNIILAHSPIYQLPALWVGTVLKNFPMAFFWNMFGAAPATRGIFQLIFREK